MKALSGPTDWILRYIKATFTFLPFLPRQVNGEDLRDATHERAIQVLRETPSTVCMLVFRDESVLRDEDIYDMFAVELMKKPGRGLGISIVGRRNDTGIFISDVVSANITYLGPGNIRLRVIHYMDCLKKIYIMALSVCLRSVCSFSLFTVCNVV